MKSRGVWIIKRFFLKLTLFIIKAYQYAVSPVLPPTCRFYPTCSEYAYQAVRRFGFLKGSFLALKRILKCHPFNSGGIDPVPDSLDHQV